MEWGIVALVIITIILVKVVKSITKVVISLLAIILLFNIGFVWTGQEISDKLFLDKIVKEEYRADKDKFINELVKKRDENSVIEAKEVEKAVKEVVSDSTKKAMEKLTEEETKAVLKELYNKIETIDTKDVDKAIKDAIKRLNNN